MKLITNFGLFIFTFLTFISLINTKSVIGSSFIPFKYCNVHGNQAWTSYLLLQGDDDSPNTALWVIEKNAGSSVSSNPSERSQIAKGSYTQMWGEFNQLCIGAPIKDYK
tara:strand:- start:192 stop:518 length:327 start_codon:yes stop_codon:yes gene_type:complete